MSSDLKLKLYNTLTRSKEEFVPLDRANVRMYVCGPTVYDFAHIGNARPAIVFDVLFRLLRHVYGADHVTYVRNITDVDDKINARAARDFPGLPLNEAIRKVTETTAAQYQKDVTALGCLEPTVQPRATDNIPQMQAIIGKLLANHHAYEAPEVGEVLFDVGSMPDYGALSGRDLDNNLAGARVEVDTHKHNPADFVLWKRSSADEPGWDSPWGLGRPGWHIECSAMSERYLGEVFDIHGGGLDLIFPHHENEIAQSRCAHGTDTVARYWMHNGFVQVEGRKMSKSEGNFVTIRDLLGSEVFGGRNWQGLVLRWAMLMTHYRQPIDWTPSRLKQAAQTMNDFTVFLADSQELAAGEGAALQDAPPAPSENLLKVLLNDLNTPEIEAILRGHMKNGRQKGSRRQLYEDMRFLGLTSLGKLGVFDLGLASLGGIATTDLSTYARKIRVAIANDEPAMVDSLMKSLNETGRTFDRLDQSFLTFKPIGGALDPTDVERKINARLAALNAKDFAKADTIRATLLAEGIQLMDSKNAAGERTTTWEIKR